MAIFFTIVCMDGLGWGGDAHLLSKPNEFGKMGGDIHA